MLGRVINPIQIAQQGPRQGTQLQKLMPFPAAAGQPRHLDAQHDAHMIQPDLRHQPLKPRPGISPRRGMPEIIIDH